MRIGIVGNTSMLGQRLLRRMREKGAEVVGIGRNPGADISWDLSLPADPPADLNLDTIIHCAASFGGNSLDEAIHNETINAVGALKVAQFASTVGCQHLVYISSLAALDVPDNGYRGSYGLSKRHAQENLEWACAQMNIGLTVLMPSQLYDERGEARMHQPLFYHIVDCARDGVDLELHGTRDPDRNMLFVEDCAEVIKRVVGARILGTFPVVHPHSFPLSRIAGMAFDTFGRGGQVRFRRDRPDIPSIPLPDDAGLYGLIAYAPATDLARGLALIRDHHPGAGGESCTPS